MTASLILLGAGPRAVAVLSRLCADAPTVAPDLDIVVHLVDAVEIGAGRTWNTQQNPFLLCNTYAAETTVFADESIPTVGPTCGGPSLSEWLDSLASVQPPVAPEVVARARSLHPWSYPPRALQGEYFRWALDRIVAEAPPHIRCVRHVKQAVALSETTNTQQTVTFADGSSLTADLVIALQGLLTSGHAPETTAIAQAASCHSLTYFAPGMPSEQTWSTIPAGESVLVRGLGANFFDLIGVLYEGRGGRFERDSDGLLHYLPSGREPFLIAGSRRGLPYRAKSYYATGLPKPQELRRFSAQREVDLLREYRGTAALDFTTDVAEDIWADFRDIYDAVARRSGVTEPFDWPRIVDPAHGRVFETENQWSAFVDEYARVEEHRIHHPESSPDKAIHRAVETTRRRLSRLVIARVFDPVSVVRDLKQSFLPQSLVTSSGPPPQRAEALFALRRAGFVDIMGPGFQVEVGAQGFVATSAVPGRRAVTTCFVEARMDLGDLRNTDDPLIQNLFQTGQARLYRVTDREGRVTNTGTLDVTDDNFFLVDAAGVPHARRIVLGSPAGDVQFNAAIGAIPHTGDKMLVGAERVAVQALRTLRQAPSGSL